MLRISYVTRKLKRLQRVYTRWITNNAVWSGGKNKIIIGFLTSVNGNVSLVLDKPKRNLTGIIAGSQFLIDLIRI